MTRERLSLYDTTLRDGAQTHGVDFSLEDKWLIAAAARRARASTISRRAIPARTRPTRGCSPRRASWGARKLAAFGMTKRPGRSLANDPGFQALLAAKTDAICLVGKTWDFHVDVALGITLDENLEGIKELVAAVVASGPRGAARLRAFLRRLQGQSRLRARLRQNCI